MADPTGISVSAADAFVVDPTWTRIDNPAAVHIVTGWSISRGRAGELDKTGTGTARIRFVDLTGDFDPTNPGAAHLSLLDPMRQAAVCLYNPVAGVWRTLFRGFVEEWTFEIDEAANRLEGELALVDALDVLAAKEVVPMSRAALDAAGATDVDEGNVFYEDSPVDVRIEAALDDADFPSALRNTFSGNADVQETVYPPGTSILAVIQEAADAEFPGVANVYVAGPRNPGFVTFHGRYARFHPDVAEYQIAQWKAGDTAAVAADDTLAPISRVRFRRSKNDIVNAALVYPYPERDPAFTEADIPNQLVTDTTSIGKYGVRAETWENVRTLHGHETPPLNAAAETKLVGQYYVDNMSVPRTRVEQIVFRAQSPDHPNAARSWQLICGVDLGDIVTLTTTHVGGGGFDEDFYVERIEYDASPKGDVPDVTLTLTVSPRAYYDPARSPFEEGDSPP